MEVGWWKSTVDMRKEAEVGAREDETDDTMKGRKVKKRK